MNTTDIPLPEIAQERVDDIERRVLGQIAAERTAAVRRRRTARRRVWAGIGAAAAVIVVAAVVGPGLSGSWTGSSAGDSAIEPGRGWSEADLGGGAGDDAGAVTDSAGGSAAEDSAEEAREVIAIATVTLETTDAAGAADDVAASAADLGGYVDSMSLQRSGTDAAASSPADPGVPGPDGAWITVRVPADRLAAAIDGLAEIGEVRSSEIRRDDVTTQAVDLRARVAALEKSVTRLLDLIADADSTAALLTAEDALSERQAELDSLRGQLTLLEDQVSLSSLTVSLIEPATVVAADPTGFGDGLSAGWNTLVATVNGIVIGLGFLLPWLAVLGVAALAAWAIARAARRRRLAVENPGSGD
ncbi:DUF4349 domain-containing protein [Microbacterium sp. 179-B 1A2 NHS]|uniref:DUF4349 domain-containing protein n=1 Tax=Microbacterium sp. 179-B 1A2 NHS TaxID=3142383 RepID=UPI0039A32238